MPIQAPIKDDIEEIVAVIITSAIWTEYVRIGLWRYIKNAAGSVFDRIVTISRTNRYDGVNPVENPVFEYANREVPRENLRFLCTAIQRCA